MSIFIVIIQEDMVPGENKLGPFIFALYCYVYG
jgi:hypothetical protein